MPSVRAFQGPVVRSPLGVTTSHDALGENTAVYLERWRLSTCTSHRDDISQSLATVDTGSSRTAKEFLRPKRNNSARPTLTLDELGPQLQT